jgi:hypothetical protein
LIQSYHPIKYVISQKCIENFRKKNYFCTKLFIYLLVCFLFLGNTEISVGDWKSLSYLWFHTVIVSFYIFMSAMTWLPMRSERLSCPNLISNENRNQPVASQYPHNASRKICQKYFFKPSTVNEKRATFQSLMLRLRI